LEAIELVLILYQPHSNNLSFRTPTFDYWHFYFTAEKCTARDSTLVENICRDIFPPSRRVNAERCAVKTLNRGGPMKKVSAYLDSLETDWLVGYRGC
jgi:hypothetical protein